MTQGPDAIVIGSALGIERPFLLGHSMGG